MLRIASTERKLICLTSIYKKEYHNKYTSRFIQLKVQVPFFMFTNEIDLT